MPDSTNGDVIVLNGDCLCGIYSKDNDKNITIYECPVHPSNMIPAVSLTGVDKWLSEGFDKGYVHYLIDKLDSRYTIMEIDELRKRLNH